MNTNILLRQLALLCDETAAALDSGGVPTLVLKTFSDAATPIWIQIGIAAKTANTPLAATLNKTANVAPQPTGRFSGAPKAAAKVAEIVEAAAAAKNAPASAVATAPAPKTATVSIPASKVETLNPARPRKMAGM